MNSLELREGARGKRMFFVRTEKGEMKKMDSRIRQQISLEKAEQVKEVAEREQME